MIKNIIFDLGDVLIDLNHKEAKKELLKLGFNELPQEMLDMNLQYEKGLISTEDFINFYKSFFENTKEEELVKMWNVIIGDFPEHRLSFLKELSQSFQLFLFSNTTELHIDHLKKKMGERFYNGFSDHFKKLYYSFELHERKPDKVGFLKIIQNNHLRPKETLFIDDLKENTHTAKELGMKVWNLIPGKEDVSDLFLKFPMLEEKGIII